MGDPGKLARHGEGELFELDRQVDPHVLDVWRQHEGDRREIHDPFDAGSHEPVGCLLGPCGWHHDHAQPDPLGVDGLSQLLDRLNADALDHFAHLLRIGVEGGGDREVLPAEAAVAEQGLAEVTCTTIPTLQVWFVPRMSRIARMSSSQR